LSLAAGESAGDLVFGVFHILAERQNGEELVAARDATERGDAQSPPKRCSESIRVFGSNAF